MTQTKQVPSQFDFAGEVKKIAVGLIRKHHTHLVNCEVAYLFKNKVIVKGGKVTIATAEKCSPKMRAISVYYEENDTPIDFIITVSYPAWNKLTDKQKVAVIDHELEHCFVEEDDEGNTTLRILAHSFADFVAIIKRHGLYMEDLKKMQQAVNNIDDPEENEDD